jgi:hypothetical protein
MPRTAEQSRQRPGMVIRMRLAQEASRQAFAYPEDARLKTHLPPARTGSDRGPGETRSLGHGVVQM